VFACVVIDQFTGFAHCQFSHEQSGQAAALALEEFIHRCPFKCRGLLLSDNGGQFLSDEFIHAAESHSLLQRTTRYHHPWSNGKCERFNQVLKFEALPIICAGWIGSIEDMQAKMNVWLLHYNAKRAHGGWVNKGLPPVALFALWEACPGDDLEKLFALGIIKRSDVAEMRVMGASLDCADLVTRSAADQSKDAGHGTLPYAFLVPARAKPPRKLGELLAPPPPPPAPPVPTNFRFAK
jgi:hypothetical protein